LIAHQFGCQHNRDNTNIDLQYAHGYIDPDLAFRTIMSYPCTVGDCPIINMFSTPNYYYGTKVAGTRTEDCARKITETVGVISDFRNPDCVDLPGMNKT